MITKTLRDIKVGDETITVCVNTDENGNEKIFRYEQWTPKTKDRVNLAAKYSKNPKDRLGPPISARNKRRLLMKQMRKELVAQGAISSRSFNELRSNKSARDAKVRKGGQS